MGFLLGGVGEINKNRQTNFMVVDKSEEEIATPGDVAFYLICPSPFCVCVDTALTELEDCLKKFILRDDIDIILINQNVSHFQRNLLLIKGVVIFQSLFLFSISLRRSQT